MRIEQYSPNACYNGSTIVVFPICLEEEVDPNGKMHTERRIMPPNSNTYRIISDRYDKASNRIRILCEALPATRFLNGARVEENPRQRSPRIAFDIKLSIPRGSLSTIKEDIIEVIDGPVMTHSDDAACKIRYSDGTEQTINGWTQLMHMYSRLIDSLQMYYVANGLPANCDRRKLSQQLKTLTGSLRDEFKGSADGFQSTSINYTAHALATFLVDQIAHFRSPYLSMQQVIDMHLLPGYPQLTERVKKGSYVQKRTTRYVGMFQKGIHNHTHNLQLAMKLSALTGTQITEKELSDAVDAVRASSSSTGNIPMAVLAPSELYAIGVSVTTKR